jgi:hypothetical protein
MSQAGFEQLINKHFNFLVKSHGYKISFVDRTSYPDLSIDDGEAEISSNKTLIYVMKSRFDYALTIGPIGEPTFTRISPTWILEALSVPLTVPPRNSDLSSFEWFLVENLHLLSTQCMLFVLGDFSGWLEILEYFIKETKEGYFSRTHKELPQYVHRELEEYIKTKKMQGHYPK